MSNQSNLGPHFDRNISWPLFVFRNTVSLIYMDHHSILEILEFLEYVHAECFFNAAWNILKSTVSNSSRMEGWYDACPTRSKCS